jgi:hypothetical protein
MNINVEFQMVCDDCGSLTIKVENPEGALEKQLFTAVIVARHEGPWARETPPTD